MGAFILLEPNKDENWIWLLSETNSIAKYPIVVASFISVFWAKTGDTRTVHFMGSWLAPSFEEVKYNFWSPALPLLLLELEDNINATRDDSSSNGFDLVSSKERNDVPVTASVACFPSKRWKAAFAWTIEKGADAFVTILYSEKRERKRRRDE